MGNVFEEIDSLKQRIYTSYGQVSAAGGAIPSELSDCTTYNLSSAVSALAQPVQDDWRLPVGWPDLREVIKNDPFKDRQGVGGRCVVLIDVLDNGLPGVKAANVDNKQTWGWFNIYSTCQNSVGWRTSNDPSIFVAVGRDDVQYIWDPSKYISALDGRKFVWVEVYYNRAYAHFGWSTGTYVVNGAWPGLRWMCGDGTHGCTMFARFARRLVAVTGFTYMTLQQYGFETDGQLVTLPPLSASSPTYNVINALNYTQMHKINFAQGGRPISATSYASFATNCLNLEEFPDILPEGNQVSNVNSVASTCTSVTRYPSVLDYSKVATNVTNFWNHSNYLRQYIDKLPDKMIFPDALTLSCQFNQMGQIYPDTIARFDAEGHLSGGWFYGWTRNPGYTTDLSVKFQTMPASWMTAAQKAEVSSYLLTKGIYVYGL